MKIKIARHVMYFMVGASFCGMLMLYFEAGKQPGAFVYTIIMGGLLCSCALHEEGNVHK